MDLKTKSLQFGKEHGVAVAIALFLLIGIPVLSSISPSFQVNIWGKYLCYAALAVSLNWLWGYTGLLCLCQSLFFALGGYMIGMHLMLLIGKLGAYKSDLPDFMVFLGYKELPSFWQPFYSFLFSGGMVILLPGLVAFIFGWLAFRSRIKGVYFSILSQALTYAATLLFFKNDIVMGGNNGFTDFRFFLGMDIRAKSTQIILYEASAVFLGLCIFFIWWITRTKFGMIQQAVRALLRLRDHGLQALRLHRERDHGWHCRCVLRAPGGHHQPERDGNVEVARCGRVGCRGWTRHALWACAWSHSGEPYEELHHALLSGLLADHLRRNLHLCGALHAEWCGRSAEATRWNVDQVQ